MRKTFNVGIIGGSGYAAKELGRILVSHQNVQIAKVTTRDSDAKLFSDLHPGFSSILDIPLSKLDPKDLSALDLVFLTYPHTESMKVISEIKKYTPSLKIIDLSADFRLPLTDFERVYKIAHLDPDLLTTATYGVPELFRDKIKESTLVANPGCFAISIILAIAPLIESTLINGKIFTSAVTGSTGSGAQPKIETHHPMRNDSFVAYSVLSHRHTVEVENTLNAIGNRSDIELNLATLSGPFSRGIYSTSFVSLMKDSTDPFKLYSSFTDKNKFVRLRKDPPRLLDIRGSNFCDISITKQRDNLVVISTIDNLVKGAAGNAIQCMNLMLGLEEDTGLNLPPLSP